MKRKIYLFFLLILYSYNVLPQDPITNSKTADRIIDGGNLIIEIIKAINKDGSERKKIKFNDSECALMNYTNICFTNKTDNIIVVKLSSKERVELHELVIYKNGSECCYKIQQGVYSYTIEQKTDKAKKNLLIRKGNILLEACKDIEIKIKY